MALLATNIEQSGVKTRTLDSEGAAPLPILRHPSFARGIVPPLAVSCWPSRRGFDQLSVPQSCVEFNRMPWFTDNATSPLKMQTSEKGLCR
jgi:hypothetical protein